MKLLRRIIIVVLLGGLTSSLGYGQNRDVRSQRLVLDDNNGNTVAIQTPAGPISGGTLTIPDPAGSGSFLITTPSSGSQSVSGHLLPGTSNTYDLGSGTFLWRSLFLGTNAQIGGSLRLIEPGGGSDYSAFIAQTQANNITYTLPGTNGSTGQLLRIASSPAPTSTAATLEWATVNSGWSLTGNGGLTDGTDNFFGTTGAVPVRFITANAERMRLTAAGVLGIGTTTPNANSIMELNRTSATLNTSGTFFAQRIDYSSQGTGPVINLYGLYADVYGTDDSAVGLHVIARGGNNVAGRFVATNGGLGIHVAQGNVLLSNTGTASELRFAEPSGSGTDYTSFMAQAQANNITYTLPSSTGSAGQVLQLASSPAPTASTATLTWGTGTAWTLTGNGGTNPTTNYLGTTDNQAFEIRVDNGGTATEGRRRVMRFEPNATSANIIGGFNGNSVTSGVVAGVIAGGGFNGSTNRVTDDFGVIGGGSSNQAGNNAGTTNDRQYATVGGGQGNIASGNNAMVGGGNSNTASGQNSTVGGGFGNTASGDNSILAGGNSNTASGEFSVVGGGSGNTATGQHSTVGGGENNTVVSENATIGGGELNTAIANYSTVDGGSENTASGVYSTVGGGSENTASDNYSTVGGGYQDTASGVYSTVGGGSGNMASNAYSTVGGGSGNIASNAYSTIGGGQSNTASGYSSTLSGGQSNTASAPHSAVSGGQSNTASGDYSIVGGGSNNATSGNASTVGGGAGDTASGHYSTVGGGFGNKALGDYSTVSGGEGNVTSTLSYATVGGGSKNTASGVSSAVGGGSENMASDNYSTVGGGYQDTASGVYSTVGGGSGNMASNAFSTVGGGSGNTASDAYSTVGGGNGNTASGGLSTVGGGNTNTASGGRSTVGGGESNQALAAYSTISGGGSNVVSGEFSTVVGGRGLTLDGNAHRSFGFHANTSIADRNMTIDAPDVAVFGNTDLWLANNDNAPSELRLFEAYNTAGAFPSGTNYTALKAATTQASDITYTLPDVAPTSNGQMLTSTTGGTMSWGNKITKATVSQDIASVAANSASTETFTVTGAAVGGSVAISPSANLTAGLIISFVRVSAANTVTVGFQNVTGSAIDEGSLNWDISVIE